MAEPLRELRELTHYVSETHDVGVVLQLFDRTGPKHAVTTFLHHALPAESLTKYNQDVFQHDPFTDTQLVATLPLSESLDLVRDTTPVIAAMRNQRQIYWQFLDQFNFTVEGVSIRQLRPGLCLSAGFLAQRGSKRQTPPAGELLSHAATMHTLMAAHLLEETLRSNVGLMSLQYTCQDQSASGRQGASRMAELSAREADVCRLVATGMQTKLVAHRLGLSEHTVVNHLRSIYAKLGVRRRAELAHLVC